MVEGLLAACTLGLPTCAAQSSKALALVDRLSTRAPLYGTCVLVVAAEEAAHVG